MIVIVIVILMEISINCGNAEWELTVSSKSNQRLRATMENTISSFKNIVLQAKILICLKQISYLGLH